MSPKTHRRTFLLSLSSGIAAAGIASHATAQSASDKLVVGLIGGGRGTHDAGNFQKMSNVELAYVCDVDESRRSKAAATLGIDSRRAVSDLRRILDDKSVDAVIIATPDHWHSPAAILAVNAGKHV